MIRVIVVSAASFAFGVGAGWLVLSLMLRHITP